MNEAEWVRAIVEAPDDTALRLRFADWLEQQGARDRATFIRQQCALAGVPKWARGWVEHWQFRAEHFDAAVQPPLPPGVRWAPFGFERGIVTRLLVERVDVFLRHASAIFARAPITSLEIHTRDVSLTRVLQRPELARIRALKITLGRVSERDIAALDDCPHLARLEKLAFVHRALDARGLHVLARSSILRRVRKLVLRSDFLEEHGRPLVDAFRDAPELPNVRALNLETNALPGAALADVLRPFTGVRELLLSDNPLSVEGAAVVASRPRLESVELSTTDARPEGVRALVDSEGLRTVRALRLRDNALGLEAATAIAEKDAWPALEFLDLGDNELTDDALTMLFASPLFARLARADVRHQGEHVRDARLRARADAWFVARPPGVGG